MPASPAITPFSAALVVLVVLVAVFINRFLGFYDGMPSPPVPPEAVPIWRKRDLSPGNRLIEYLSPLVVPTASMVNCPFENADLECMSRARNAMKRVNRMGWNLKKIKKNKYTELSAMVKRRGVEFEVVIVHPTASTDEELEQAPIIFWFHGGGFVFGEARDSYMITLMEGMQHCCSNAVWVSIDYPLSPEFKYPMAANICGDALQYFLQDYKLYGRVTLGGGGLHIAGASAGAILAVQAAQRALESQIAVNSIYSDNLFLPIKNELDNTMFESPSFRQNWFTRLTPVEWVTWFVKAYGSTNFGDAQKTLSVNYWRQFVSGNRLPPAIIVTCSGDIFLDAANSFIETYRNAGGNLTHIKAKASHAVHLIFDKEARENLFSAWGELIAPSFEAV